MHVAFNKPTPVSNILKMLIKTCIIPLKIYRSEKTTSITFKFISKQTLIFCLFQWIIFGATICFMMVYKTGIKTILTWFMEKFYNSNFIDFVSLVCIMNFAVIIPCFSLPFSKRLTYVANEIILSQNLQLPNHWTKFVLFSIICAISSLVYLFITLKYSNLGRNGGVNCIPFFDQ